MNFLEISLKTEHTSVPAHLKIYCSDELVFDDLIDKNLVIKKQFETPKVFELKIIKTGKNIDLVKKDHIQKVQIEKVSRYLVGKITLKTSNTSNTPKVKSVQFRALARPELVVARIPINISDRVERPGRKPLKVKGLGDTLYNALRDKEGDAVTLEIFDPNEIIRGVVESISYPVQSNTEVGSVVQYAILTVRGTRQNVVTDVTSAEVFGINALGFMKFGA